MRCTPEGCHTAPGTRAGEVIPLEFNIDGLQGISFTKGCYVGQELMARTHFKGVVRKRAMPFRLQQPAPGGCVGWGGGAQRGRAPGTRGA